MPAHAEVELDIFSGMPNPAWTLADTEAESLVERLAALPQAPPREFSGNLGYRGFIIRLMQGAATQSIRVQRGAVHISNGQTDVYARDADRSLERWLLDTGRPHLKTDLLQVVEREVR
jgi:hypothetical protein